MIYELMIVFCKLLFFKKFILNIAISNIIILSVTATVCFMEDLCGIKLETRVRSAPIGEGVFQIYCDNWFWAIEKEIGCMIRKVWAK